MQRCTGLQLAGGAPPARPYVSITLQHFPRPYDTALGSGGSPTFQDATTFAIVRSPAVEQQLALSSLELAVFDDAQVAPAPIVNVASLHT